MPMGLTTTRRPRGAPFAPRSGSTLPRMPRPLRRALAALLLALLIAPFAHAQAPAVTPGSWASQLDELTRWVEAHRGPAACTERCFALTRLRITGSLEPGPLQFELEGAVLADGLQRVGRGLINGYQAVTESAAMVQGVTPVAITLPAYDRAVVVSRELVARERPFRPRVYYVTSWTTGALALAWVALALLLARSHRETLTRWGAALRDRLRADEPSAPGEAP